MADWSHTAKPTDGKELGGPNAVALSAVVSDTEPDTTEKSGANSSAIFKSVGDGTGSDGRAGGGGEDGDAGAACDSSMVVEGDPAVYVGEKGDGLICAETAGEGEAAGNAEVDNGEKSHADEKGGDEPATTVDGDDVAETTIAAATTSAAPLSGIDEIEIATGCGDDGGPSSLMGMGPPSPLTGCYLLIILGEPHSQQHKDIILQRLIKGIYTNII